ncbi:MAG: class I SAM-dependent methyltransferase [wastewater metagenome]|nr:class I SAM-dependent methyltransferase [Candidatus Loosdrechtia aerotolerans]
MYSFKKNVSYFLIFLFVAIYSAQGFLLSVLYADERDRQFWDRRYNTEEYIYSKEPVEFLKEHVDILPKGKALDIAMGEGRNAVFLAKNGFEVDGCDISEVAVRKARKLAEEHDVKIHAFVADLEIYELPENTYDVIVCFYYLQRSLVPQIKKALKPGGVVVYETYTVENLECGYKGPKNRNYLLEPNELLDLFSDLNIVFYREIVLDNKKAIASLIARK